MFHRSSILLAMLLLMLGSQAQNAFTINGRLKIDGGDLAGARLVIYKNGQKERTLANGLNKFSFDLDIGHNYILSFEKDGFVSKKLSFNTKVPAEAASKQFTPFDFAVSLFKQYDDLNLIVFNQPVGVIRYEPAMGDLDYDTDYTKSIQAQLQTAMAAVEQRQKEEAKNSGAEAKRKAAEERAAAQAKEQKELEARKAAEAQAKVEEQVRVEAVRKQEEQKKKEEERVAAAEVKKEEPKASTGQKAIPKVEAKKEVTASSPAAPMKEMPAERPQRELSVARPVKRSQVGTASVIKGEEQRRSIRPVTGDESGSIGDPALRTGADADAALQELEAERQEELLEEPNKVTKVIRLTRGEQTTEYRKVIHKWGAVYYFKNGSACSQQTYETEAMIESQLAGATARPRLDR